MSLKPRDSSVAVNALNLLLHTLICIALLSSMSIKHNGDPTTTTISDKPLPGGEFLITLSSLAWLLVYWKTYTIHIQSFITTRSFGRFIGQVGCLVKITVLLTKCETNTWNFLFILIYFLYFLLIYLYLYTNFMIFR